MNAKQPTPSDTGFSPDSWLAQTHEVINQPPALENYNLFQQDKALQAAVEREGAGWARGELDRFGKLAGRRETIELGFQANDNKPTFHTHDRFGHRIDEVRFHRLCRGYSETAIVETDVDLAGGIRPETGIHLLDLTTTTQERLNVCLQLGPNAGATGNGVVIVHLRPAARRVQAAFIQFTHG